MIKFPTFILITLFCFNLSFAQFNIQYQDPKTPEAYLFEKYGNVSISEYNGRQNLTIPLHTINYGDISFPLNLTYNSNGIRVDEEASRVGLGWYFGVGMISQIVQGKDDLSESVNLEVPDFYNTPYPQYALTPYPVSGQPYCISTLSSYDLNRLQLNASNPTKDTYAMIKVQSEGCDGTTGDNSVLFPRNLANLNQFHNYNEELRNQYSGADTERDLFQANFFGHDILFHMHEYNNTIRVVNDDRYKISKTYDATTKKYTWFITDPSGIIYEFKEELVSVHGGTFSPGYSTTITAANSGYETYVSTMDSNYNPRSSFNRVSRIWKITKITDLKGNEVTFDYEPLSTIRSQNSKSGSLFFRDVTRWTASNAFGPSYFSGPINPSLPNTSLFTAISGITSTLTQEKSVLKRISYSNTKLEFNLSARLDIPHDKRIEDIQLLESNQVIKSIDFTYSYFNPNHTDDEQKRLRLDEINANGKIYGFDYEGSFMPDKNSLSFDYWGLYNGMSNQTVATNPFRLFEDVNHIPSWVKPLVSSLNTIVNRSAHPINCKVGMLTKIVYPTGGSTEFIYELNTFDNIYFPNYNNKLNFNGNTFNTDFSQTYSQGYGLRIKETIDYTKINEVALKKRYTYTGGKHISPYVSNNQDLYQEYNFNYGSQGGAPFSTRYEARGSQLTSYFNNLYQTSLLGNGEGVGYDSITIETIDDSGANNGKTILYYTNVPDKSARDMFGQGGTANQGDYDKFAYSIRNTDIDNGNLIRKEIYNSQDDIVQKIEYTYQSIVPFSSNRNGAFSEITYNVKNIFLGSWAKVERPCCGDCTTTYCNYYHHMFYFYPIKKTKTLLDTEKVTNYFNFNTVETLKTYTYNSYNLPTGFNLKDSDGNIFVDQTKVLTTYNAANIYTFPLSVTDKENGLITKQFVNIYDPNNNYTLSRVDYYPRGSGNPHHKKYFFYDLYDGKGNINQFHTEDGIYTTIIWGYDDRYPIAKIENATYSDISNQVSNLQSLSNADNDNSIGPSGTEGILRSALDNLRNLPVLSSSLVTTYTHDPLIGVTSITDPRGNTTYYKYDDFNRLEQVKDSDGNILSENEYNYRQ